MHNAGARRQTQYKTHTYSVCAVRESSNMIWNASNTAATMSSSRSISNGRVNDNWTNVEREMSWCCIKPGGFFFFSATQAPFCLTYPTHRARHENPLLKANNPISHWKFIKTINTHTETQRHRHTRRESRITQKNRELPSSVWQKGECEQRRQISYTQRAVIAKRTQWPRPLALVCVLRVYTAIAHVLCIINISIKHCINPFAWGMAQLCVPRYTYIYCSSDGGTELSQAIAKKTKNKSIVIVGGGNRAAI